MISRRRILLTLSWPLAMLTFGPAVAGNAVPPPADAALPGVEGGYRIVKPVEAEPEQADVAPGHFKVGDVDVHVSGSITVDVGIGSLPAPKH